MQKDREMAANLKKFGIQRTTGQCPWGCGASLMIGGKSLTVHLNVCRGKVRNPKAITRV